MKKVFAEFTFLKVEIRTASIGIDPDDVYVFTFLQVEFRTYGSVKDIVLTQTFTFLQVEIRTAFTIRLRSFNESIYIPTSRDSNTYAPDMMDLYSKFTFLQVKIRTE